MVVRPRGERAVHGGLQVIAADQLRAEHVLSEARHQNIAQVRVPMPRDRTLTRERPQVPQLLLRAAGGAIAAQLCLDRAHLHAEARLRDRGPARRGGVAPRRGGEHFRPSEE